VEDRATTVSEQEIGRSRDVSRKTAPPDLF
jgi:hypothetical protein